MNSDNDKIKCSHDISKFSEYSNYFKYKNNTEKKKLKFKKKAISPSRSTFKHKKHRR
jgi:hypothetical protein